MFSVPNEPPYRKPQVNPRNDIARIARTYLTAAERLTDRRWTRTASLKLDDALSLWSWASGVTS
jgi:hypothetical protein